MKGWGWGNVPPPATISAASMEDYFQRGHAAYGVGLWITHDGDNPRALRALNNRWGQAMRSGGPAHNDVGHAALEVFGEETVNAICALVRLGRYGLARDILTKWVEARA